MVINLIALILCLYFWWNSRDKEKENSLSPDKKPSLSDISTDWKVSDLYEGYFYTVFNGKVAWYKWEDIQYRVRQDDLFDLDELKNNS